MQLIAKIVGKIILDMFPGCNIGEAINRYSKLLLSRVEFKMRNKIDYDDDVEIYVFLKSFSDKIAEEIDKGGKND